MFDYHATLYRLDSTKNWKRYGAGKLQLAATDNSNEFQLLLYRGDERIICCNQIITKDTQFNESQMPESVLTWVGLDLAEFLGKKQEWALKFDDMDKCKSFYNVILTSIAIWKRKSLDECPSMEELLELSTKESAEEFKHRCVSAYKTAKDRKLLQNIQIWNDVNATLGITTEKRRQYYERLCQNYNQTSMNEFNE